MSLIIPAVIIGGVSYVAVNAQDAPTLPGTVTVRPTSGSTIKSVLAGRQFSLARINLAGAPRTESRLTPTSPVLPSALNWLGWGSRAGSTPGNVDPGVQAKLDQIEAAAQHKYEQMSASARAAAAAAMNKELGLAGDAALDASSTWRDISAAAGAAGGSAGGAAACGPACGKVGAMAGAYLGEKFHDLMAKHGDDLKRWLDEKIWGSIQDAAGEVKDFIGGLNPF